jgi:DNA-binding XRE family transcriptional regulator
MFCIFLPGVRRCNLNARNVPKKSNRWQVLWPFPCPTLAICSCHTNTVRMANTYQDFRKIVGNNVRYLRRKSNLTQDRLAERCGLYRTYLSRIEAGRANPTLLMLVALAISLQVDICDLFSTLPRSDNRGS